MALTKKIRGTNIFRTVFFMPNLIGGIELGYIWQLIFNGILAKYETALGLNEWYGTKNISSTNLLCQCHCKQAATIVESYDSNDDAVYHNLYVPFYHKWI